MPDITEVYAFLFCPFIEQNLFGRYQNIFTPTKKGCNLAKGCAVAVFMRKITQRSGNCRVSFVLVSHSAQTNHKNSSVVIIIN